MKKLLALSFMIFGCAHTGSEGSRGPSSVAGFHPLTASALIATCRNMFQPSVNTANVPRRQCERTYQSSEGNKCQVSLLATDAQYAKISSASEIFSPLPKTSTITSRMREIKSVKSYGVRVNKVYQGPSGALVHVQCDIGNLTAPAADPATPFESWAPRITNHLIEFNASPVVDDEGVPPAQ